MGQRKHLSLYVWIVLSSVLLILTACDEPSIDRAISPQPISLELLRLDQGLFDGSKSVRVRHEELVHEHGEAYAFYFERALQLGAPTDSLAPRYLERFVSDSEWQYAQEQIDSVFSENDALQANFESAFSRYHAMFPEKDIPRVMLLNTGYNYGVYPEPRLGLLGLGAEFYIGAGNPLIGRLPNEVFPAYMREQMIPEQLLPDGLKGWLLATYEEPQEKLDLLHLMVTYGKIMYTLHLCIPDVPEHLHFSYSAEEFRWCEENEQEIWKTIVKEKLLYSTDRKTLTDWTGRGPFTRGFSEASPAELAYFMGKQMVKDYMSDYPDVSPAELVKVPATVILKSYTPD